MKIKNLNIEGYIGSADSLSIFNGEQTFSLSKLKKFLNELDADVTDIHVYINSGGGSISEGWAIYDKLKASGKTITTIGEGIVGSIATIIFAAGSVRQLHENSKFFIHNPYWLPGEAAPMEGEDLINLGKELQGEQTKIVNFYSKITNKSAEEIAPLMDKATDLTSEQAVKMGFAHSIVDGDVVKHNYKLVALIENKTIKTNINPKTKQMSKDKSNALMAFNKVSKLLNSLLGGEIVNMELMVTDKDGNMVNLFIESDTEDLTGKTAYLIDADGNQVEANGDFTDENGKVIKIEAGIVTEVVEAAAAIDETEALKAEIETLKASLLAKDTEIESFKANIETVNNEFKALKSVVIGAKADFSASAQTFSNQKPTEPKETNAFLDGLAKAVSKKK